MKKQLLSVFLTSAISAGIAGVGQAQTTPDGQWHGAVSFGASFASGNTKSTSMALNADSVRATAADKMSLYGSYLRSSTGNVTGADIGRVGARYDYNLSADIFAFTGVGLERDKIKGIKMHSDVNAGVGVHVLKDPNHSWDVFGGLGYGRDQYFGNKATSGSMEALLGEESSHKLNANTTFKQRLVVYPAFKSDRGMRGAFDANLATSLVGAWTINLGLATRFSTKTPVGIKKYDHIATVGVGMKF